MVKITDDVLKAWDSLRDDADATKWMLCSYEDKKTIGLSGKGPGGRAACLAQVAASPAEIQFGAFVVVAIDDRSNTTSKRTKFVFFHYQAPDAPMMRRAAAGSHRTELQNACAGSHVQFQVDALSELSEAEIVAKLRRCGGAHQPTGFDFGEGDVGEGAAAAAEVATAPVKNARDFAPDNVRGLTPDAECAAREKEYQTANVLNSSASVARKAAVAAAPAPAPPPATTPPAPPPAPTPPAPPVAAMAAASVADSPPPAPAGGDAVVLLVTSMPATTIIEGNQGLLRNMMKGKKVSAVEEVDGLEPANKALRSELFGLSGLRGQYPQVFVRTGGALTFVGDFEKLTSLNDCEELPAEVLAANPQIETFSKVFAAFIK